MMSPQRSFIWRVSFTPARTISAGSVAAAMPAPSAGTSASSSIASTSAIRIARFVPMLL